MRAEVEAIAAELRPELRPIDLRRARSVHIVGIGGAGMRAIARVLLQMGHRVSGSDRAASPFLDELAALGAVVHVGHEAANVEGAELVTRSTAVPDDNPEVEAALVSDIAVFSRAEMLAAMTALRPAVLVAGTHGKTTTSSMLAVLLDRVGRRPSFVIGSDVTHFGTGARWSGPTVDDESPEHATEPYSPEFVVEADESDGTFLALRASHAIVTSLDPDHLEFYGSPERLSASFEAFVDAVPGTTAVCLDDPDTGVLLDALGVATYGTFAGADLHLTGIASAGDTVSFDATWRGAELGPVTVGLPGRHNALNAAGALTIALAMGIEPAAAIAALAGFTGVARRYETRGERLGIRFVDDYAHLPAEVEVAIATARAGGWNRVIATYQPHRFSRTQALGATFATSFRGVDHLVLTDIYPSGESPRPGVTGRIVHDAVVAACPELSVSWQPSLDDVTRHLLDSLGPGDLCLTLGAGDLTTVPDRVLDALRDVRPESVAWLGLLEEELSSSTVELNARIGPLTTYRVGGAALALVKAGTRADLERVASACRTNGSPVLVVGRGSNLLVADRGVRAVAVQLVGEFEEIDIVGTRVRMGAAVSLPAAARRTVSAGLTGFEWAVGVPGSVGGAVAMNAGGHGSDMAASVVEASVLDLRTGHLATFDRRDLGFGYRRSSIGPEHVVLDATLELAPGDRATGEALVSDIVRWRRENQPGGQNAGSVFTNPDGDSAGRLIDAAGVKGLRHGSAEVSSKHANFIQADPGGRADDVHALMTKVAALVREHAGVELDPETRLVGFASPLRALAAADDSERHDDG